MNIIYKALVITVLSLLSNVEAQSVFEGRFVPIPIPQPNEVPLNYLPRLGRIYYGNYTTPDSDGQWVYGEYGNTSGRATEVQSRIGIGETFGNSKLPDLVTPSKRRRFGLTHAPGTLDIDIQLTMETWGEEFSNVTFVGLNYNINYTDFSDATADSPTGNLSAWYNGTSVSEILQSYNLTIQLTGPIYLPENRTLTNRSCAEVLPYNCGLAPGRPQYEEACGQIVRIPVTSLQSYMYFFPAGYIGFNDNGTLEDMAKAVWGLSVYAAYPGTRDRPVSYHTSVSCEQFPQVRLNNGFPVAAAATKMSSYSWAFIVSPIAAVLLLI